MTGADQYADGIGQPASLCATASLFSSASPTSSLLPTPDVPPQPTGPDPPTRCPPPQRPAVASEPPSTQAATRSPLHHQLKSHASTAPDATQPRSHVPSSGRSCSAAPSPPRSFLQPPSSWLLSPYDTDEVVSAASMYNARYRHTFRGADSSSTAHPDSFYDPNGAMPRERHLWHVWPERSSSAPLSTTSTSDMASMTACYAAAPPLPLAAQAHTVDSPEIAAGMRWLHTGHSWPPLWQPGAAGRAAFTSPLQPQPAAALRVHALPRPGRGGEPSLAHILLPPPLLSDFASTELATTTEEAERSAPLPGTCERMLEERRTLERMPSSFRAGDVYIHTNPMSGMELAVEEPSGTEDTFMNSSMASDWALHPSAAAAQEAARPVPMKLMAEIAPARGQPWKHPPEDALREHIVPMTHKLVVRRCGFAAAGGPPWPLQQWFVSV